MEADQPDACDATQQFSPHLPFSQVITTNTNGFVHVRGAVTVAGVRQLRRGPATAGAGRTSERKLDGPSYLVAFLEQPAATVARESEPSGVLIGSG